ncbi:DNA polymerase III subunit gamma/tau [[Clostridium] polysaccharolyticum]|uniref:DNA-directed DNA polymerase n=1 Tax=[Clostridium] polysaccharolyticum TaxID=29364 RepID=A0A1I0DAI6_9FIRM|nr:DNA polymerase III subunit gamma/tau [[Clostridium] polysaccharolyticum]SET29267.1 DNA polymerase-3 subunit gamma/tau [[Clostridium] polysaccharolyticum]
MSYTALYRKFRPSEFEDVKGQDHIVKTLKNQIKAERIGHAYLFCGTRGTGKTTIAKILAKAVNCEHPIDGSPCNECEMCQKMNHHTSMNVIEIDAASNNGVDNIREIIDEVQYSPTEGRYKVYIIDEVHMLSTGAFNALLKTLEEPPSYVIFILATTEVHKIPITILSRCQRYDFKRITIEVIANRLIELMEKEQVDVEERAIRYVAKAADGSLRDALSLLDQCIAFYFGETLTFDKVLEVLGAVDIEVFHHLLSVVLAEDVPAAMKLVEDIVITGRELGQFVVDFTWYLRNLLLLKTSEDAEQMLDVSSEQAAALKNHADNLSVETLMRYIRIFSELSNQLKYATQKRVLLELAIIKLCKPQMEQNYDSILDRLGKLEQQIANGVTVSAAQNPMARAQASLESVSLAEAQPVELPKALPEDLKEAARQWEIIKGMLGGSVRAGINDATPTAQGDTLVLVFDKAVSYKMLSEESNIQEIEQAIKDCIQKEVKVQTKLLEENQSKKNIIDISQKVNMPIEYED